MAADAATAGQLLVQSSGGTEVLGLCLSLGYRTSNWGRDRGLGGDHRAPRLRVTQELTFYSAGGGGRGRDGHFSDVEVSCAGRKSAFKVA